jgi:hypothetical protein
MKNIPNKQLRLPRRITTLALTGLILSTSVGLSKQAGLALPLAQSPVTSEPLVQKPFLPTSVEEKVRQEASRQLNASPSAITIVSFSQQTWSDSCLGLGGAAESCLQAIVEGWRVEVTNGQRNLVYRTDATGNAIRLEPPSEGATLPTDINQRLLQTVARQVRVPVSRLRVAAVRSATWDGCLGIFRPGQACTKIAIPGWQTVVTNGDRSWVYHLDQSANRIAQNPTASGSRVVPSFIPEQNYPDIEEKVIFQSIVSGDLTGRTTRLTLTQDGAITQFITAPNIRSRPVVIKRLSPQQVEQFQQVLQRQRFPNLNHLRYLTSAALADYPTTTLQGMGTTVQYIDLESKNLPRALQAVVQTWERLSSPANR